MSTITLANILQKLPIAPESLQLDWDYFPLVQTIAVQAEFALLHSRVTADNFTLNVTKVTGSPVYFTISFLKFPPGGTSIVFFTIILQHSRELHLGLSLNMKPPQSLSCTLASSWQSHCHAHHPYNIKSCIRAKQNIRHLLHAVSIISCLLTISHPMSIYTFNSTTWTEVDCQLETNLSHGSNILHISWVSTPALSLKNQLQYHTG